ncbi:MAG TPA: hypothetical protein VGB14_13820 [Acidimicrobiales bacterium]
MPIDTRPFDREWDRLTHSREASYALAQWRDEPLLAAEFLDDLVDRTLSAPPATADAVLAALVRQALAGDKTAPMVLLRCLKPGLSALAVRLAWTPERTSVFDDLVALAWERIVTYPIDRRPSKIAANVVLDVRKRYVAALTPPSGELLVDDVTKHAPRDRSAEQAALEGMHHQRGRDDGLRALVDGAVSAGALTAATADLFWRCRVLNEDPSAVAAATGVSVDSLRRRCHRAASVLAGRLGMPSGTRRTRTAGSLSPDVRAAVVRYALDHPDHGPRTIATRLRWVQHGGHVDSHGSVHQMLRDAGLSTRERRRASRDQAA